MNWEAIGAIGEITGALAVLVTLAYLATQVRQNTKAIRASTLSTWIDATNAANTLHYRNADFVERALAGGDDLSDSEMRRFHVQVVQTFNALEAVYLFHMSGIVDTEFFESKMRITESVLAHPGVRSWWRRRGRSILDSRFVQYVEGHPSLAPGLRGPGS